MNRPLPLTAFSLLVLLCFAPLGLAADSDSTAPSYSDFTLADMHGKPHTLSSYRGRWVILNFWATWCPPCQRELPELVAYQAAHPEQVLLGIDFEQVDPHELQSFASAHHLNYPVLILGNHTLKGLEPIEGLPTTIIITPSGELIAKHVGPVTQQTLEEFIGREQAAMDKAAGAAAH